MKSMVPLGIAAFAAVLVLTEAPAARADGLQAGQWKVITKPQNNGVAGPPLQNMRCLSATDVSDLEKTFSPVSRTTNSTCEQTEHESSPQRLKWRLQCTGQIDMDVAGEFVFDNAGALHRDRGRAFVDDGPSDERRAHRNRRAAGRGLPVDLVIAANQLSSPRRRRPICRGLAMEQMVETYLTAVVIGPRLRGDDSGG